MMTTKQLFGVSFIIPRNPREVQSPESSSISETQRLHRYTVVSFDVETAHDFILEHTARELRTPR